MRTEETTRTNLGRGRSPRAGAGKRAPLPGWLPKASKGERGRDAAPPAHIRLFGVELDPDDRIYIRRKLGMKLGKFASSIERVSVRAEDVNGPSGGIDHECRVKVVLSDQPTVMFVERDASLAAAVDRALAGSERAVRRAVRRRRMKGLKRGRRTGQQGRRAAGRALH